MIQAILPLIEVINSCVQLRFRLCG